MFQFHSSQLTTPPSWQAEGEAIRQDWSGEIGGMAAEGRTMVSYADPAAASSAVQTPRGESQLDMQTHLPAEMVEAPTTAAEAYQGSMKAILNRNKGNCILASFLVGTQNMVSWEGILYDVGTDYLVIYQDDVDRYVLGDIYSLKFVEFFDSHGQPCAGYRREIPKNVRVW